MRGILAGVVAIHLAVTLWHGSAHQQLGITLPTAKNVFVYVVILLAPVVAALLVWFHRRTLGVWLFFLSMLGSLLFGVYHHFLLVSADNIHHLPAGGHGARTAFVASAVTLALVELAGAIYGALCLRSRAPQAAVTGRV